MVDPTKIVQALQATLNPSQQKEAEAYLDEIKKIISFCPSLLQIMMSADIDIPVRQAGAIYLKNTVNRFWKEHVPSDPDEPMPFSLHEQDKAHLRAAIIDAMMHSPDPIMQQLKVCMTTMVQNDFPGRWSAELPEKLGQSVATENLTLLPGALTAVYTTVKVFQYTKSSERGPIDETMTRILPLLQQRILQAVGDTTSFGAGIQKLILKIFFAYTNNFLPPMLESDHQLVLHWTELLTRILRHPLPSECAVVDIDDRPELVWWKVKKWAMHILCSWFEKFAPNDSLAKKEARFGDWYVKAVPGPVLQSVFEWLDKSSRGEYISPRLLLHMLNYLETAVPYSHTWNYLKPHIHDVIVRVCFPILCHSEEDAELWQTDPVEYVKVKFDIFEEIGSPALSAQNLVHTASQKRREVLNKCMQFCVQLINSETASPRDRDGAFRIVGAVADLLMSKKLYKKEVQSFVVDKVFPQVQAQEGFLRARACWLLQQFSAAEFSKETLHHIAEIVRRSLVDEKELPVRMEAAMALQSLLCDQEEYAEIAKSHVPQIVNALLDTMRQTSNDDLNSVLQKIFLEYREEIGPLAVSIVQQLAETFVQLLKANSGEDGGPSDDDEDKAVLAMGILTTLETIASVLEEDSQLMSQLEPIMLDIVQYILTEGIIDYYEEAISLAHSLICERVSPTMWTVLPLIYQCFERDGVDYFSDMMNPLHCYITVDPEAFLSDPARVDIVLRMCSKVLDTGAGEDAEYHAAKLLEVLLLQFPGRLDSLVPRILQPAMARLTRPIVSSELRAMCILVGVAALLHWPELTLQLLCQHGDGDLFSQFLRQWLQDVDCFLSLHDRKLSVLGLCTLLTCPEAQMPPSVVAALPKFIPSFLMLFDGLKSVYQLKGKRDTEDSDEGENDNSASRNGAESDDEESKELASDEDDVDPEQEAYVEHLQKLGENDDDDDDDLDDDDLDDLVNPTYETSLDKDECELDEYTTFKETIERLNGSNVYNQLFASINQKQSEELKEVLQLAIQRQDQRQSKKIEQAGGYTFAHTAVPTVFNFGAGAQPPNFTCSPPGPGGSA